MKKYQVNPQVKVINSIMQTFVRMGLGPKHTYLLTVQGRRSGKPYSTPVTIVESNEGRWLVAPYGEMNWVRNARASGQVTLSRGGRSERLSIAEEAPEVSARVLKTYVTLEPITRPYFEATVDSSVEAFQAEAVRPVFRLIRLTGGMAKKVQMNLYSGPIHRWD
jgi:deazaflavin-dependent oxidoreductase (nitroreductase family)